MYINSQPPEPLSREEIAAVSPNLRALLRWSPDEGKTTFFFSQDNPKRLEQIKKRYQKYLKNKYKYEEDYL